MHFRVSLTVGKKGSQSRVLHVRANDIMDAMTIGKKIRGGRINHIESISYEDYMKGVHAKYEPPVWKHNR
tara:strand:- start:37 stop:246 length:210 start_codon:yes stop_codon:yes gene_type:complete